MNKGNVLKSIFLFSLLYVVPSHAQTANDNIAQDTIQINDSNPILERQTLTGKWGGLRPKLREKGLLFKAGFANYYQGMVSGEGNKDFEFGSKFGLTSIFNGQKLGLWEGFFTIVRVEYNMGNSVNNRGGTVLPVNTALAYPGIEGSDRLDMNIYFIQFLSKTDKIVLGKINNMDMGNFSTFSGGLGMRHFQNNAFVGPPNGITVPYVFGAYYLSGNDKRDLTFAVYDSNSRVNRIGFKDLFQDGITFFGSADLITNFFGKKGKQGLAGAYSTKEVRNLNDLENFFPPLGNYIGERSNRWSLAYFFEQTLFTNPDDNTQKFGVFGQAGLTDGKGSFADYYFNLGVSGSSPFKKRHQDRWGLGYFYYTFSDGLSEFSAPTVPGIFPGVLVNDRESGFEAYYETQLTQWFSLGVNYQLLTPGVTEAFGNRNETVSFLGLRSILKL